MGCDELKSPILFFLVHRLRILKKQIWKSNNFAVGWITIAMIMMIDSDHLFDSTWNIAETHNLLTILYWFCIISIGPSSLPSTSQKRAYFFCKRHISFINFPLWLLQNVHLQIKEMYQTSLLKLLGFYAITCTPSWWNI